MANVLWCTGFRPDFGWIHPPVFDDAARPRQYRGVITSAPGLYILGLPFQYGFTSMLVAGAGRDAAYIVDRIVRVAAEPTPVESAAGMARS